MCGNGPSPFRHNFLLSTAKKAGTNLAGLIEGSIQVPFRYVAHKPCQE